MGYRTLRQSPPPRKLIDFIWSCDRLESIEYPLPLRVAANSVVQFGTRIASHGRGKRREST